MSEKGGGARLSLWSAALRRAGAAGLLIGFTLGVVACNRTAAGDSSAAVKPAEGGGGTGGGRGGRGRGRGAGGGAQPVDVAAVGNVEAYTSVSVKAQITGQLQQAFFHEGDVVKKGDKLFSIDPR